MGGLTIAPPGVTPYRPEPLDLTKGVRLASLLGAQQAQTQGVQLENQQRQQQIQSQQRQQQEQQVIQQAIAQNPGKTYSDILPQLRGRITPQTWTALAEADQKIRKGYSDQTKTDLENSQAQHGQYQQLYDSVMQLPDQQVLQSWPQIAQQIDSIPGNKIQLDPQKPMTKQQLQQFGPFLSLNDAYLQSELAKREQKAKLSSEESDATIKAQQAQMAQSGGGAIGTGLDVQEANSWLRKNPGRDLADYQKYKATLVPAFKFNLNQGAGGGEANDDELARGMVDGTLDITKLASIRSGRREALVTKAMQLDPTFSMTTYPQRLRVQEKFSSGKAADQISSLNTFAGHVADASDLVDGLRNSNSPWLNAPVNKVAVGLGNDKIAPFQAALEAAKDEYLSFLKGGHAPQQQELELAEKLVNPNQSPAQLQAVLKQMTNTILIRAGSLNSEYARTMHKDYPMLNQDSVQALAKLGYGERAAKFAGGGSAGSNSPGPTASDPFAAFEGKARR